MTNGGVNVLLYLSSSIRSSSINKFCHKYFQNFLLALKKKINSEAKICTSGSLIGSSSMVPVIPKLSAFLAEIIKI